MVRSRQIEQKLSFWLMLIGYNPRDKSLVHRIYLIYALIFMSLWGFAMLSLAAGTTASALALMGNGSVGQSATQVSLLILVVWFMYQFWQVSRRSPFVFSEEDAYLICQTPVKRNIVAISWFVGDWLTRAWPFWTIGVTLGFALVESRLTGKAVFDDFLLYFSSGLRALSMFLLLHLGLLAMLWALGALRLQGKREWRWYPLLALVAILLGSGSLVWVITDSRQALLILGIILWPLNFSLQTAFSLQGWGSGALTATGIAVVGLLALAITGDKINLSRASQETSLKEKLQSARRYGMFDLAEQIKKRERLGIGRDPTCLSARPGLWTLPWKDILQSRRSMGLGGILNWLILLGVSSGLFLAPDSGSRLLIFASWLIIVCQRMTSRLRDDMTNWWTLRSLPFQAGHLLLTDLALPWGLTVIIGWMGILLGGAGLGSSRLIAALLIAPICLIVGLISIFDILRQSKAEMLLNGNVPGISALAVLGGALCLAVIAGITLWIGWPLALAASILLAYGTWHMAANKYRSIS
jgi:hypothetical protein